jgi:hypothetical protein
VPETSVDLSAFGLFVSPVEGHIVSRYGTGSPTHEPSMIGYVREDLPEDEKGAGPRFRNRGAGKPVMLPDHIEAITKTEYGKYELEYARALRVGALEKRTADEYLAYIESQAERARAAAAEAEAKAVVRTESAAGNDEQEPAPTDGEGSTEPETTEQPQS